MKARLVADFRGINRRLRRPEYPLEGSWGILRRLDPRDKYFAAVDSDLEIILALLAD